MPALAVWRRMLLPRLSRDDEEPPCAHGQPLAPLSLTHTILWSRKRGAAHNTAADIVSLSVAGDWEISSAGGIGPPGRPGPSTSLDIISYRTASVKLKI